jgi:hypothetical protein
MIYWGLFSLILIAASTHFVKDLKSFSVIFFYSVWVILVVFSGFRFESIDYYGYLDIWNKLSFDVIGYPFYKASGGTTGNEFVYASLTSLFKLVGLSFEFFVFFVALVSISIKLFFYKKLSPYFLFCIVVYMSLGFSKELGQIRNALASAILLFGLKPLVDRKFCTYFFVVIFAFGVQSFAIVCLFIYWFYPIVKYGKYFPYFLLVFAFLASAFGGFFRFFNFFVSYFPDAMSNKVYGYIDNIEPLYYHPLNISFLIFGFVFLRYREFIGHSNELLLGLVTYHIFALTFYFIFFDFSMIGGRIFELLSFSSIIVLSSVFLHLFHGVNRFFYIFFVFLYSALVFYSVVPGLGDYKTIIS